MKKGTILIISLLSIATFARTPRVELEDRALRVANRLKQVMQNNVDAMSRGELKEATALMRKAIRIARGDDSGSVGRSFIVKANLEADSMAIEANSIDELRTKCMAKVRKISTNVVDDVSVKVVGGQMLTIRNNSSYWRNPATKCSVVVKLAVESAFGMGMKLSNKKYVITGSGDSVMIFAEGNSLSELENSCKSNLILSNAMDDINVRLNGGNAKYKRNSSSYWRSNAEVCSVATSLLF
jgi:hypothetical protein